MSAPPPTAVELAEFRALVERVLGELLELRAEVRGLRRGGQGLDEGRAAAIQKAQKQAAYTRQVVIELAMADKQAGRPDRGRPGRISRKLAGRVGTSESRIRKILRALSSARDSS